MKTIPLRESVGMIPNGAILVTAATDAEHLARSAGIPHFLQKPFAIDQLDDLLNKAIANHS